ncbi:MAG: hypothetical protein IKO72_08090 [Kiritimatiellae bacterium]|nr:hypothetical protein [Kiritimatiellia bacterium]
MSWHVICPITGLDETVDEFPFYVGRHPGPTGNCAVIDDPCISRQQFKLEKKLTGVRYVNLSDTNPGELDGVIIPVEIKLAPFQSHILKLGEIVIGLGTDYTQTRKAALDNSPDLYMVTKRDGGESGPFTGEQIVEGCEKGYFTPMTKVRTLQNPGTVMNMADVVDFDMPEPSNPASQTESSRTVTAEETKAELGESFMCPYCRTVSALEDVLSVSVSPGLLGDPVLGPGEQSRFLPSKFNANGLAIDSEGGTCTEIACPRCHMSLPRSLLDTPQMVMSVVGAAGAGKSVFLASSMWQCRQMLSRLFGVSFMDLDPVANRWINAYEEKLFFQEDDTTLQQIEKTDLQASNVSRSVMLDGDNVLLPLPSFFQLRTRGGDQPQSLVVYDSAGEHFRAGADTQASAVTLNMLNSDTLFFMFDPSADPRFRSYLDRGGGTARNYAQRQDILLSEMAARIRRHLGNRSETRLSKPLIFGVSKADLLRRRLSLNVPIYKGDKSGAYALDLDVLRDVSRQTETFLDEIAPEVTATAHDIASDVWFVPVSALGHNPMREGVRPCDIKPVWTELPVVFTLAKKGLVPVSGEW